MKLWIEDRIDQNLGEEDRTLYWHLARGIYFFLQQTPQHSINHSPIRTSSLVSDTSLVFGHTGHDIDLEGRTWQSTKTTMKMTGIIASRVRRCGCKDIRWEAHRFRWWREVTSLQPYNLDERKKSCVIGWKGITGVKAVPASHLASSKICTNSYIFDITCMRSFIRCILHPKRPTVWIW